MGSWDEAGGQGADDGSAGYHLFVPQQESKIITGLVRHWFLHGLAEICDADSYRISKGRRFYGVRMYFFPGGDVLLR